MERKVKTACRFSQLGLGPGPWAYKETLLFQKSYDKSLYELETDGPHSAGHHTPDKGHWLEMDEGTASHLAKLIGRLWGQ